MEVEAQKKKTVSLDGQRIYHLLLDLGQAWPNGQKVLSNKKIILLYSARLTELNIPAAVVEVALTRLIDTSKFFPSFAEILGGARTLSEPPTERERGITKKLGTRSGRR